MSRPLPYGSKQGFFSREPANHGIWFVSLSARIIPRHGIERGATPLRTTIL